MLRLQLEEQAVDVDDPCNLDGAPRVKLGQATRNVLAFLPGTCGSVLCVKHDANALLARAGPQRVAGVG